MALVVLSNIAEKLGFTIFCSDVNFNLSLRLVFFLRLDISVHTVVGIVASALSKDVVVSNACILIISASLSQISKQFSILVGFGSAFANPRLGVLTGLANTNCVGGVIAPTASKPV